MDGISDDSRTRNFLCHLPSFVPRIFSGKDETIISEKAGSVHKKLHFRCVCQRAKVKVPIKVEDNSAKAVGEKFAASPKLQEHAHCASKSAGESYTSSLGARKLSRAPSVTMPRTVTTVTMA